MMADVINAGTGNRARQLGFTLPAAGKTGTTNDFNDAWFVGYTPKIVTGVWVGFDQPRTILPNGFAGDVAVPVWAKFMKVATAGDKPEWFKAPSGVTTASVCRLSGQLATAGCEDVEVVGKNGELLRKSMVYTEYFDRGTEPTSYCDLHPIPRRARHAGRALRVRRPPGAAPHRGHRHPAGRPLRSRWPRAATATVSSRWRRRRQKKRGFWSRIFGKGKGGESGRGGRRGATEKEERWLK